jgi:hypothetical protein
VTIIAPVIKSYEPSFIPAKLIIKYCPMNRITGNTISILCQDDVHTTISNKVSQSIETRTVQIRSRYPILELSYDLILMLLAIRSQSLKLLTEGVPLIPLLLCAHTSV